MTTKTAVSFSLSDSDVEVIHNALSVFILMAVPTDKWEAGQINKAYDLLNGFAPYLTITEKEGK